MPGGIVMRKYLVAVVMASGLCLGSTAAVAQNAIEGRVDRLEREMRAVQRKVFPGGNGQYFPPDIAPADPAVGPAPGSPSGTPLIDLTSRVDALEKRVSTLTGQIEQLQYAYDAYKRTTDARLRVIEERASTPATAVTVEPTSPPPPATAPVTRPGPTRPTAVTPTPATGTPAKGKPTPATPAPAKADPARAKRVAAVERPTTDDPADDAYVYGYRLWQAKLYPEAQVQLKDVVAKYPKHRRASWAQNLLGRAYLDEGKPSFASLAFYDNYDKFHDGERTPDSLLFLAVALKKLGKPAASICPVYDTLTDEYAARLTPQMKAEIATGRATEKCKAK